MEARGATFTPATLEDGAEAAAHLREADRLEVLASEGDTPTEACEGSIRRSEEAWAMRLSGELAAVFGVVRPSMLEEACIIWLLSTDAVDRHPVSFVRACRAGLAEISERYPLLVNLIDARYEAALRWVQRLGFDVLDAAPHGIEGRPFHLVVLRRR